MIELTSFHTGTSTCDHTGTLTSVQTGTWISFQTATSWGTQIYLKFIVKMSCTWVIYALSTYRLWNLLPIGNLIFLFFCNLIKNSLSKILSYFFFLPCWNFFLNLCNKKTRRWNFATQLVFMTFVTYHMWFFDDFPIRNFDFTPNWNFDVLPNGHLNLLVLGLPHFLII